MTSAPSRTPGSHGVLFYDLPRFPVWSIAAFLGEAVRHERPALVLATRPVFDAVSSRLGLSGDDDRIEAGGPLAWLDVDAAFASFMDGDRPDFHRFQNSFDEVTGRIRRSYGDGPVWLYGEQAGGLYRDGNHSAALRVEEEWNARFAGPSLAVLCGYPTPEGATVPHLDAICAQHQHIVPANDVSDEATVYVIDDDPSVRRSLARLLKSAGLRAQTFASAEAFLALSDPMSNGCVILDVQLAGMSGSELQSHMSQFLGAMPVVVMSGAADPQVERLSLQLGASAFLRKPFHSRALMDVLARVLA